MGNEILKESGEWRVECTFGVLIGFFLTNWGMAQVLELGNIEKVTMIMEALALYITLA